MKKDAYYFPHFSNARNDAKLVKLRRVMGIEGYGIYFLLLEILREQTNFRLPINTLEDLAYEWHTSKEKLIAVVTNFDLFEIIDETFISTKLIMYLQPYIEKSERARIAANKRWSNANAYANTLPEHSKSNASKGEETKLKKSKEEFAKAVNDYGYCMKLTSAKKEWYDMSDEEKQKAIIHIPKFRKKYENDDKIEYLYDFFTYLKEKMYTIEIKKTTINNIQYPTL